MDIPDRIPPALILKNALRTTLPAFARDIMQVSLVQPQNRHAVPTNRAEELSVIPPKLRPETLAIALPVVEKLAAVVTSTGFGADMLMPKASDRFWTEVTIDNDCTLERGILRSMLLLLDQNDASILDWGTPMTPVLPA
jgi:hypothetical protein